MRRRSSLVSAKASRPLQATARSLLAGIFDGAAVLNRELLIVEHNATFAALTGLRARVLRRRILEGTRPFDLVGHVEGLDRTSAELCVQEERGVQLVEQPAINAAGEKLTVSIGFIPLRGEDGAVEGVLQTIRNVTTEASVHRRLEDALALAHATTGDLERALQDRTEQLRAALEQVSKLSRTDPLTGLLNRRMFGELAQQAIDLAERHQRKVAILMFDLDHLKLVNERYGLDTGDALLRATAAVLEGNIRQSDRAARLGGEEFAVLLSETQPAGALRVAERFTHLIRQIPIGEIIGDAVRPQTASVGVAVFPDHARTLDELISHADMALYVAKQSGRDRAVLYEPGMGETTSATPEDARPRALLVASDQEMLDRWQASLRDRYQVITAPSASGATFMLRQSSYFDAIVADERLIDRSGVDFLGDSLNGEPGTVRILIVESADFYLAMHATNRARVDCFLLRSDTEARLADAIEDGIARREVLRERFANSHGTKSNRVLGAHVVEQVLSEKNVDFAFQPIFRTADRSRYALEALCRLPAHLPLGPEELFDAALRSGLIWRLGRLGREAILRRVSDLDPNLLLFLNMHPAEIEDPQLAANDHPLHAIAHRVVFEITERASIPDFAHFRAQLERLQQHGYRFAIDDLGAGYASLSAVALLEPDFIKLDRQLLSESRASERRLGLIRRIVDFAREHGIQIIAEGIETEEEAACAADLGCHLMQGYLLGRPEMISRAPA